MIRNSFIPACKVPAVNSADASVLRIEYDSEMIPSPKQWLAPATLALLTSLASTPVLAAAQPEPLRYTVAIRDTASRIAEVRGVIPTSGDSQVQLMMPVWSPGFYRVEDYAAKVEGLEAKGEDGAALAVNHPQPNTWVVEAGKRERFVLSYRLLCDRRSVTTNEIAANYAVLNPGATLVVSRRAVQRGRWPIELTLEVPSEWSAMSALRGLKSASNSSFTAPDYETLVDSPILAGKLSVHEFSVGGTDHVFADAGDIGAWDGAKAARDLTKVVDETRRFWGSLPFKRYVFLNVFRQGGGGLEHKDSTLLTANAGTAANPRAYLGWLNFVAHEYVHAFNVKRLRPIELGPFDFDKAPRTSSLWISEGATTYIANLIVRRSGLSSRDEFLAGLSALIRNLQKQPGRLVQTVEQSSLEVWDNSMSGVNPTEKTVSYYVKGAVLGFVLDARIRKATGGRKSFDALMRAAYNRYSGERGFTREEFQATASKVAGLDLAPWFQKATASTEELDYREALDWFGLSFIDTEDAEKQWTLAVRENATPEQTRNLAAWIGAPAGN
jgi:predicted metalloprotease with PDZ domain